MAYARTDRTACGRHVTKETLDNAEMRSLISSRPTSCPISWVITFRRQSSVGKAKLEKKGLNDVHREICKEQIGRNIVCLFLEFTLTYKTYEILNRPQQMFYISSNRFNANNSSQPTIWRAARAAWQRTMPSGKGMWTRHGNSVDSGEKSRRSTRNGVQHSATTNSELCPSQRCGNFQKLLFYLTYM